MSFFSQLHRKKPLPDPTVCAFEVDRFEQIGSKRPPPIWGGIFFFVLGGVDNNVTHVVYVSWLFVKPFSKSTIWRSGNHQSNDVTHEDWSFSKLWSFHPSFEHQIVYSSAIKPIRFCGALAGFFCETRKQARKGFRNNAVEHTIGLFVAPGRWWNSVLRRKSQWSRMPPTRSICFEAVID